MEYSVVCAGIAGKRRFHLEMNAGAQKVIALLIALLLHTTARGEIDWSSVPDMSTRDKRAITELVRETGFEFAGMQETFNIAERRLLPGTGKIYVISTKVIESDLRRTWREMYVCPIGQWGCGENRAARSGKWAVWEQRTRQERWHFSDHNLAIDVELGTGISYAEAKTIISAIHHGLLITTSELEKFANFDAARITSIRTIDPVAREFAVRIGDRGSWELLSLRLVDDEVHLFDLAMVRA